MADYGIAVYKANGTTPLINQGLSGGTLYVDTVVQTVGSSQTYVYDKVPGGSNLRVMLVQAGAHVFSVGTNASGYATLTVTYLSSYGSANATVLFVFATSTVEPTYGVQLINDAGDRLVSTLYPVPEFLGAVTTTNTGGNSIPYNWTASTTVGSGKKRMVLWKIPDTTNTYFSGTCYIPDTVTGSYSVACNSYMTLGASETYAAPVAYIFSLGPTSSSGDAYGVRVYDGSGNIMFDSGKQMMSLVKSQTYDFGYAITVSQMSGISPAILLPSLTANTGNSSSYFAGYDTITGEPLYGYLYTALYGTIRKNGTTLETKYFAVDNGSGWTANDYYNGQDTGLCSVITNSASYA